MRSSSSGPPKLSSARASMITKVCHIAVADLWGGAEVHLVTLLLSLSKIQDLEMSVVLFTEGRVAQELRAAGLEVVVIAEHEHNLFVILWKLVKHFRKHQFMVVHAHKPKDNFLGGGGLQVGRCTVPCQDASWVVGAIFRLSAFQDQSL